MVGTTHPISPFVLATDTNLGAVEITTFLSLVLLGISLSQGYTYFQRSAGDKISLKLLVSLLLVLECFHSFTASHTIFLETVTRWNRGEANSYPLSFNVLNENIITFLVQSFFCYRIYRLSKRLPLTVFCALLSILRFVGGIALSVESILDVPRTPNGRFVISFSWLITGALSIGATADVCIALSLVYYLRKFASPENMESTTTLLNRLVLWTLQTGILTSMLSFTVIICFQSMPNMIWFALYIVLAKLYSISLLVSLNARPRNGQPISGRDSTLSAIRFSSAPPITISLHAPRDGDLPLWSPIYQPKFNVESV